METLTILQIWEEIPPRRRQALRLALEGHSNAEIAKKMKIVKATVRKHFSRLYTHFGLANYDGERFSLRGELLALFNQDGSLAG
jgi:DNA-binding NarL/FixJ family response regulator